MYINIYQLFGLYYKIVYICSMKNHKLQNLPNLPGIYKIQNLINGKVYIGSSKNIKNRGRAHLSQLRLNKHFNILLQNSWNKYGENNFNFEVLEICKDLNTLEDKENHFINSTRTYDKTIGYNLSRFSDYLRSKRTQEQIKKSSEKHKKPILQFTKEGVFIKEWDCANTITEELGYKKSRLSAACYNKYGNKTYKDFIWIFKKDYNNTLLSNRINQAKSRQGIKIYKYDNFDNLIYIFNSLSEVCRNDNLNRDLIRKTMKQSTNMTINNYKYTW